MTEPADSVRARAIEAAREGRAGEAAALFDQAVLRAPFNVSILNSAAAFHARQGQSERAIAILRQAVAADANDAEALLNLALLLTQNNEPKQALALLEDRDTTLYTNVRYWSARANAERAIGRKRDALASFDRAARLDPQNSNALHGRARMSLETGLAAGDHYRHAVTANPGDATAWLGFAQALEAEGDAEQAQQIARSLVEQHPGWIEALELLAQLRWAADDRKAFTDHYGGPSDVAVVLSRCRMLAGIDRFAEAAEVAAEARAIHHTDPLLALVEAIHRGEAGDDDRAESIFATLAVESVDRFVHEARHRLRIGQLNEAEELLARAIAAAPDHIAAWALRGIAWRLLGDPRADWLYQPDRLIRFISLELDDEELGQAAACLDRLHDGSTMPVGQSVRNGSQTRGGLFDRHEREVAAIEQGYRRAVDEYREQLPPEDPTHPLLRYRNSPWTFAGSWSVRLFESGRHTEHIHPLGLLSSAAYFAVPAATGEADSQREGWLELGRPPPDLRLNLEPLTAIRPELGSCALFPSFLYHGTRPFSAGKRMSVAIDINLERER